MSQNSIELVVQLLNLDMSTAKDRLKSLSATSKAAKRDFEWMTASFKAADMSWTATKKMYTWMSLAVGKAGDLQSEMNRVRAELMGSGKDAKVLADEMKQLKATAFAVQAWSPFDMKQIADLEKELLKAGATVEQIQGKSGAAAAAAALATHEGMDPAKAGKALVGIAAPYKLTGDKFMNLADLISRVSSAAKVDIEDVLNTAKGAAGPLAKLGLSTKEMLALSALMAKKGVDGKKGNKEIEEFYRKSKKDKSLDEMVKTMDGSASLQDKVTEQMSGFNEQLKNLKDNANSTIGLLFQPALAPLNSLIEGTNDLVSSIGESAVENEKLGKGVSATSIAALGLGALATVGFGLHGALKGRKVLKKVGGLKELIGGGEDFDVKGILKGKMIQAATGVTAVFVTNWPGSEKKDKEDNKLWFPESLKKGLSFGSKVKELLTVGRTLVAGASGATIAGTLGAGALAAYGVNQAYQAITTGRSDINDALNLFIEKSVNYQPAHMQPVQNKISIQILPDGRVVQEGNMQADLSVNRGAHK